MKCGRSALLFVFAYLHRLRDALPGRVTLTVVSDEETGGRWGSAWLGENWADVLGDCVLNAEPSGLQTLRFGQTSILWVRLRIPGPGGLHGYPPTRRRAKQAG